MSRKGNTPHIGRAAAQILSKQYVGTEPSPGSNLTSNSALGDALNFYNYVFGRKEAIEFLHEYLEKNDKDTLKKIKKVDDMKVTTTLGWVARMRSRNCILTDQTIDFYNRNIKFLLSTIPAPVEKPKEPSKPVFEFWYIAELEDEIDHFIWNDYKTDFVFQNWVKAESLPLSAITHIGAYYKPLLAELEAIPKVKELKEGFKMTKAQREAYIALVRSFTEGAESIVENRKRVRAPRKKRKVSVENLIKGLKYQAEEKTLNIASISPTKIIGATELVTFNTKTRKLAIYKASSGQKLAIKGSTLVNVDLKTSKQKTIRKPHETVPVAAKAGKRELNKLWNSLTTTEAVAQNGRINKNDILLSVF
jgi:hypothetical protein